MFWVIEVKTIHSINVQHSETVPFEQLASTKYPDACMMPVSGSMLGIWADEPANEYKEESLPGPWESICQPQ